MNMSYDQKVLIVVVELQTCDHHFTKAVMDRINRFELHVLIFCKANALVFRIGKTAHIEYVWGHLVESAWLFHIIS
jgi:hypothetical protein